MKELLKKVAEFQVLRKSEGKILKPKGFKPVDLTDLI